MKIIVFGADGYIGWPLSMSLAKDGHEVICVDNYLKRDLVKKYNCEPLFETENMEKRCRYFGEINSLPIRAINMNLGDYYNLKWLIDSTEPDAVVDLAEIPSAPFSMIGYEEAKTTMQNNLNGTMALAHVVKDYAPECHIVKLGTMGEYGTPDYPIREGWLELEHEGHKEKFLYPASPGSMYHVTKVQDTHMLWMYSKLFDLKVTDIMQGPVYGMLTDDIDEDSLYTNFYYDDVFGTVVNRFMVQAVSGVPMTVYGKGHQRRGYLNLIDSIKAIKILIENPPESFRIVNQISELLTVNEIADMVCKAASLIGFDASIEHIPNPRQEKESHYYEVDSEGLRRLGWDPVRMAPDTLSRMIGLVFKYKDNIDKSKILPRYSWNN